MLVCGRVQWTITTTCVVTSVLICFIFNFVQADVLVVDSENITQDVFPDFPAEFSPAIPRNGLKGRLVLAEPPNACSDIAGPPVSNSSDDSYFVLVKRYGCTFERKALKAYLKGYKAVIIYNIDSNIIEPFGQKNADLDIPTVLVGESDGRSLLKNYLYSSGYSIVITAELPFNLNNYLLPFAIVVAICFMIMLIFTVVKCYRDRRRTRRNRLPSKQLKKIPVKKYKKGDEYDVCAICLEDYNEGEKLRILPCSHAYHTRCVDPWLTNNKRNCPVCKRKVFVNDGDKSDSESDSDGDATTSTERTPLLSSSQSTGRSTYSHSTSLIVQAEQEAGPSSVPSSSTDNVPSMQAERSNEPLAVTIVPSLHSLNGDLSGDEAANAEPITSENGNTSQESRRSRKERSKNRDFIV